MTAKGTPLSTFTLATRRPWADQVRTDLPPDELPTSSRFAIVTEWAGKFAAVLAVVLFILVLLAIHKGLLVQHTAKTVVTDFRTTNQYFADRADLTAPATARKQLEQLRAVLDDLNSAGARDVDQLNALLPDARALLVAGQNDSQIAEQLRGVTGSLQSAATSIHKIAATADNTVAQVAVKLDQALRLARQLNAELNRTTVKLAPIPAQDGLIPPPGEN
ncbi:hypothetical protein [Gordonia insulae]|uniref:Transmembrane protein n=1 Tax=Gordonia insulae TaxID=2420509 RepID=A0A3G8JP77_9ACTN|nr:hypothetical protein [Gordonia insulae]AZG46816.1 hypothetical protein D7316_03421 [Gordonia insulae]